MNILTISKEQHELVLRVLYCFGLKYHGREPFKTALERYSWESFPVLCVDFTKKYIHGHYTGNEDTSLEALFAELTRQAASIARDISSIVVAPGYTAIIGAETTKVGCQKFANARVLELAEAVRKLG